MTPSDRSFVGRSPRWLDSGGETTKTKNDTMVANSWMDSSSELTWFQFSRSLFVIRDVDRFLDSLHVVKAMKMSIEVRMSVREDTTSDDEADELDDD